MGIATIEGYVRPKRGSRCLPRRSRSGRWAASPVRTGRVARHGVVPGLAVVLVLVLTACSAEEPGSASGDGTDRAVGDGTASQETPATNDEAEAAGSMSAAWRQVAAQPVPDDRVAGTSRMLSVAETAAGFVAVGTHLSDDAGEATGLVWTSADGVSWTAVEHDAEVFGDAVMRSVTATGDGVVAVGHNAPRDEALVWTSRDGQRWVRAEQAPALVGRDGGDRLGMESVVALDAGLSGEGGPELVAGGWSADGAALWTSPDGAQWSRIASDDLDGADTSGVEIRSIASNGEVIVALGIVPDEDRGVVLTSDDAHSWQQQPLDVGGSPAGQVTAVGGVATVAGGFVAVGTGVEGALVWKSTDGVTWTEVEDGGNLSGVSLSAVSATADGVVAVGAQHGSAAVLTSPDAESWSPVDDPASFDLPGEQVAWAVVGTDNGVVVCGADLAAGGPAVWTDLSPDGDAIIITAQGLPASVPGDGALADDQAEESVDPDGAGDGAGDRDGGVQGEPDEVIRVTTDGIEGAPQGQELIAWLIERLGEPDRDSGWVLNIVDEEERLLFWGSFGVAMTSFDQPRSYGAARFDLTGAPHPLVEPPSGVEYGMRWSDVATRGAWWDEGYGYWELSAEGLSGMVEHSGGWIGDPGPSDPILSVVVGPIGFFYFDD